MQALTRLTAAVLAGIAVTATALPAQSLLDRPPNLSGNWVGRPGQVYFNFLHRFTASDPPERKVSNVPTFTLAAALPANTLLGFHYATSSQLTPRYPNEWEFFVRNQPFSQEAGAPFDVGGQIAYNLSAEGVDGEVSLARRMGPVRLIAVGRALSDPFDDGYHVAAGGGATVRLSRYFALAGDIASLIDADNDEKAAWSAGIQIALPYTPHTFSLHAANTNAYTLQGLSRGEDFVWYGFEFTVPITLARWFGGGGGDVEPAATPEQPAAPPAAAPAAPVAADSVEQAGMRNLAFTPSRIEITAGTTVEWTNDDPLAHTVTAVDGSFDSGLIQPGASWSHTFTEPGTYDFACTPHPFMTGVVVVR